MKNRINRKKVDLTGYPGMVVIYLGMRVNRIGGLGTLLKTGVNIRREVSSQPEGMLLHGSQFYDRG